VKIPEETISYEDVELQADLTYVEEPSKILVENWKQLRNRAIKYCKVQWRHHPEREATWKKEEDLRTAYPNSSGTPYPKLRDEILLRGEVCNVPACRTTPG
jgi:hypothetical protein